MGKKWIWGLVLLFILSLIIRLIVRFGDYDYFRGVGLVFFIIYAVLLFIIFRVFFAGYLPRTKEEAKNFKGSDMMTRMFLIVSTLAVLILLVGALSFTFAVAYGGTPLIFKIIIWLVFLFSIFFWFQIRKLHGSKKRK